MMEELIALAGDLVFERKRLSESLRRLESALLQGDAGRQTNEGLHGELDSLARSVDRLGALARTLVHQMQNDRLVRCEPLLGEAASIVSRAAERHKRPSEVEYKSGDVRMDRDLLERFKPVFFEMLETFVEYSVEPARERTARKKRPNAFFQFDVKAMEDGYRIRVVCDGNGVMPPEAARHGLALARAGVRATFEGRPGQWSAWLFYLPTGQGAFRCVTARIGKRKLCIPAFAVNETGFVSGSGSDKKKLWALGDSLTRFQVEAAYVGNYGIHRVEVGAGNQTVDYVVDEISPPEEVFMKPLDSTYNAGGRFLGVVVAEGEAESSELCLVVNPAYLVYGDEGTASPSGQTEAASAG